MKIYKKCEKCKGKGWFHGNINPVNFFRRKEFCSKCKGTGKILKEK
jgi:DnaJ-class molecular chaperone